MKNTTQNSQRMKKLMRMPKYIEGPRTQSLRNSTNKDSHPNKQRQPPSKTPPSTDFSACSIPAQLAHTVKDRKHG